MRSQVQCEAQAYQQRGLPGNRAGRTKKRARKALRPVEKLYRNFCERLADVCETEANVMRNIPVCTMVIFNSSVLCEPGVMNGANNSNGWKPLTRIGKRDLAAADSGEVCKRATSRDGETHGRGRGGLFG